MTISNHKVQDKGCLCHNSRLPSSVQSLTYGHEIKADNGKKFDTPNPVPLNEDTGSIYPFSGTDFYIRWVKSSDRIQHHCSYPFLLVKRHLRDHVEPAP